MPIGALERPGGGRVMRFIPAPGGIIDGGGMEIGPGPPVGPGPEDDDDDDDAAAAGGAPGIPPVLAEALMGGGADIEPMPGIGGIPGMAPKLPRPAERKAGMASIGFRSTGALGGMPVRCCACVIQRGKRKGDGSKAVHSWQGDKRSEHTHTHTHTEAFEQARARSHCKELTTTNNRPSPHSRPQASSSPLLTCTHSTQSTRHTLFASCLSPLTWRPQTRAEQ